MKNMKGRLMRPGDLTFAFVLMSFMFLLSKSGVGKPGYLTIESL
jgi:hypothetical protein